MDTVTRRKFLKLTTGAVAVGAAAPLLSIDQIAQAAIDRPPASWNTNSGRRNLVWWK